MESIVFLSLLFAALVNCAWGRLNSGDSRDIQGFNYPAPSVSSPAPPPAAASVALGEIPGNLFNNLQFPPEEVTEAGNRYSSQGNLRKSFSYEPIKKPRGKARYEALKLTINDRLVGYNESFTENPQDGSSPKRKNIVRGRSFPSTTTEKNEAIDQASSIGTLSGPNANGQQPYRHWSTEPNVIREEHPDGLYSYPYIRSGEDSSRGNLKRIYELSSTEAPRSTNSVYPNNPNIHAIIPATTYRTSTTKNLGYSFGFSSRNQSRLETGDMRGNFRGTIKYNYPYGETRNIDYEGNSEVGIVTTERPSVVNIPQRPIQKYFTPSTPRPATRTRDGLTYSFSSPATGVEYSPYTASTRQIPVSSTPNPQLINRGETVYQPPQIYQEPVQAYVPAGAGDPYTYYENTPPKYALIQPNYGSYMFSYDAGDHQRKEMRDNVGNVHGMYSFDGTDGERKRVDYEANSEKGFVARGRHLPIQPVELTGDYYQQPTPSPESDPSPTDGTYFFSYNAGEHMREERKDENGNIRGMYSFLTGDGQRKTVTYRANPNEGFVASGDDIPNLGDGSYSVNYRLGDPAYSPVFGLRNQYHPQVPIVS